MKLPKPTIKNEKVKKILNILNKKWIKVIAVIVVIIVIANIVLSRIGGNMQTMSSAVLAGSVATVERRDINANISSSGTIDPLDTYSVTTLVSGEVIAADFEEGDQVAKDQVLYQINTDDVNKKIESAQKNIERAQRSYNTAVENYNDALELYDDLAVKATAAGQLTEFDLEVGDSISAGVSIGTITDSATMLLKIPFNSAEVGNELIGQTATVQIEDTLEVLYGTVTKINHTEKPLTGGRVVKEVTIEVTNPGGLTSDYAATAAIGGLSSSDVGAFEVAKEKTLFAKAGGEITAIYANVGDYVAKDQVLLSLDKKDVDNQVKNYKNSMNSAKDSLDDAYTSLEDLQESLDDYQVKAPIAGEIVNKAVKAGDNISNSSGITSLATIYDMSAYTFDMSIDELDISSIAVGQEVIVTADALEGIAMSAYIEKISLVSVNSNGITQYPVTVRMNEIGELLPGMSVNGEIVVDSVEDVLAIPVNALMRGNLVYLKDDTVTEAVGDVPVGYRAVEVEVGTMNDDYVEIISGLSEGDEVYTAATGSSNMGMNMQFGGGGNGGGPGGGGGEAHIGG